ncbi:hypothetical protein [Rossellomorea marisflavi]|uniref:hypothetical protein n=1 Tax=Rossellomorea marisflavi TaxID=189381 RepID=UPI00345CDB81
MGYENQNSPMIRVDNKELKQELKSDFNTLSTGINTDINQFKNQTTAQLADKTNKTEHVYLQTQVNNLVLGAVGDGNNAEVVQARGNYPILNDRLTDFGNALNTGINNLLTNGDFSKGITGWTPINSILSVINKTMNVTGNGEHHSPAFMQLNSNGHLVIGKKYYFRFKARVTNTLSTAISYHDGSGYATIITKPIQNQWYDISIVFTPTAHYSAFVLRHAYADAATANGKVMEIQNFLAVCLTDSFGLGKEPTKEEMDDLVGKISNNWWDGSLQNSSFVKSLFEKIRKNDETIQQITAPPTKRDLEIIVPHNVYTVANDLTTSLIYGRNYSANLVIDHMFNLNEYDKDLRFKGKGDSFPIQSPFVNDGTDNGVIVNKGVVVNKEAITVEFESNDFNTSPKQFNHISTKASAGKNKKAFVLTIGDSISNGHLSDINRIDEVKPNQLVYWAKVKKLFEMDKIDAGDKSDEYNVFFLGQRTRRDIKIDYKGKSRTVSASAEAYGGWSLYSMLRHQNLMNGSQATWDLLGLGNSSGTDYTGSQAQRDLIASTNQTFTGKPVNPFFDNNKTGANRFSIAKWLERYRTLDDNGERLTLGNGTGSEITSANLNTINVCTPTHVYLQMGANDLGGRTTPEKFLSNVKEFVSTVREQLPNAIIGINLTQDYAGTFFPSKFKEFDNCKINYWGHDFHYKSAKLLLDWFKNKDEVAEKVFLIPNFFVQPSAYSMPYIKYSNPEAEADDLLEGSVRLIKYGAGPDIHPNYNANAAWAYQVYSWLKYTLTLS